MPPKGMAMAEGIRRPADKSLLSLWSVQSPYDRFRDKCQASIFELFLYIHRAAKSAMPTRSHACGQVF